MLRILFAAIAGGAALQLWSFFSAAALPWPGLAAGPLPPPTMTASHAIAIEDGEGEAESFFPSESSPVPASPLVQSDSTPPTAFTRVSTVHLDFDARAMGLMIDLVIGLMAALAALALPVDTHWSRRAGLLVIGGLFAVLMGDLSQAAAMQWPLRYSAVLCIDHFGAVVCVAAASSLVLFCPRLGRAP
jgi:hypothetical protein